LKYSLQHSSLCNGGLVSHIGLVTACLRQCCAAYSAQYISNYKFTGSLLKHSLIRTSILLKLGQSRYFLPSLLRHHERSLRSTAVWYPKTRLPKMGVHYEIPGMKFVRSTHLPSISERNLESITTFRRNLGILSPPIMVIKELRLCWNPRPRIACLVHGWRTALAKVIQIS
jgi:hypothetical protein